MTLLPFALFLATTGQLPAVATLSEAQRGQISEFRNFLDKEAKHLQKKYADKTKDEMREIVGKACEHQFKNAIWTIWDPLGPGAHSFVWVTEYVFIDGKVARVRRYEEGVGCILIYPVDRDH
jgi:hypothetical protein